MTHQVLNEVELTEINMETEWPLPVKAINTLIDSHSIQKIQDLGGIETIAVALRTNLKEGLPAEEEQNNFERRYARYPFQPIADCKRLIRAFTITSLITNPKLYKK